MAVNGYQPRTTPLPPSNHARTLRTLSPGHYPVVQYTIHRESSDIYTPTSPLSTESVQRTPGTLQCVHHIEGCHRFPLSVFSVCNGIPDHLYMRNSQLLIHPTWR